MLNPEDAFKLENFDRELELRWNIASFLPAYAEDMFDVVIGGYLVDVRNEYRRLLGIDVGGDEDSLFTQKRQMALAKYAEKKNKKKKLGQNRLTKKKGNDKVSGTPTCNDSPLIENICEIYISSHLI